MLVERQYVKDILGDVSVRMANGQVGAAFKPVAKPFFSQQPYGNLRMDLGEVILYSDLKHNLLSISQLTRAGWKAEFNKIGILISPRGEKLRLRQDTGLYFLEVSSRMGWRSV